MSEAEKYRPPEQSAGDIAYAITRAGISFIPLAGAPAIELLQILVSPPLEKRRDQWMREVGETLRELEKNKGIKLEALQSYDTFIDTVLQATQIAKNKPKRKTRCSPECNC